ncbi:transposase [Streptosporangium canum]|uniref:transposase n=1 Tax=Streptosporangium canum TaxID=324952 RepID=UPI003F4E1BE7
MGGPMVHDLRATLDAIGYVTRYGIEWRAVPVDCPPHEAVCAFFLRWSRRGLPERLAGQLRGRLRVPAGRDAMPTAGGIDSQTVKAAETAGAAACGYDGARNRRGKSGISQSTRSGCCSRWSSPPPSSDLRTQTGTAPGADLVGDRTPDDPPSGPRSGRPATPRWLGRPAAATRTDQSRPARQSPGHPALAGLAEGPHWPRSWGSRTTTASAFNCPSGPTRATSTRSDQLSTAPRS